MFKILKSLHFIGLTLFLGSIWVFIVQGTPEGDFAITQYVRMSVVGYIQVLTMPGLIIMILTGIGMVLLRKSLLNTSFFKVKLIIPVIILINASYILHIAKKAAICSQSLPSELPQLQSLAMQETVIGSVNVALALFLIFYSMLSRKSSAKQSKQ